jgi:hypothetical protein
MHTGTARETKLTHRGVVPIEEGPQEGRGDGPVQIGLRHLVVKDGIVRKLATSHRYRSFDGPGIDDGIAPRGKFRRCQRTDAHSHPDLAGGICC